MMHAVALHSQESCRFHVLRMCTYPFNQSILPPFLNGGVSTLLLVHPLHVPKGVHSDALPYSGLDQGAASCRIY